MKKIFGVSLIAFLCGLAAPLGAQAVLVLPYVQPGESAASLDAKRLFWFTDQAPGEFTVEYWLPGGQARNAVPTRLALDFPKLKVMEPAKKDAVKQAKKAAETDEEVEEKKEPKVIMPPEKEQHYFKYAATLPDLPLDADIRYLVKLKGKTIREAVVRTRASAGKSVRCVLVGDMAQGRPYQHEIAYRIAQERPEFLVALGDIVYPTGRLFHYMHFFWDTYNNMAKADPKVGAPLMANVTFYPLMGNHDIGAKLTKVPDALGAYYFFTPPHNGPGEGPWVTPLDGEAAAIAKFRADNKDGYPFIDAYSFDYGPAHFAIINVNPTMKLDAPAFLRWLEDDLKNAQGRWKFVCYHMPAFHSSKQHYAEQQARPLSPLFEGAGVALTFAGHVHNYQRSLPIKFLPDAEQGKKGRFDGKFTLDTTFDGSGNTTPQGVIHIVAGGGGASLYKPGVDKTADYLQKTYGANYAAFTAKTVVEEHSFVVLDLAPERVEMRTLSISGEQLDAITVTKGK